MATTIDFRNTEATPADMACCGGQGCPACGDDDPPELAALRARLGVRSFGGATWTPPGFGADRVPAVADPDPDLDGIQF